MTNPVPEFDPFKSYAAALSLWADTARTVQTQWVQSVGKMAAQTQNMVKWKQMDVPVFNFTIAPNEEQMREAFQTAADVNLNTWTHAANLLSSLPRWAHWPTEVPGRVITDFFHHMHTQPSQRPANDVDTPDESAHVKSSASKPDLLDAPDGEPDDLAQIKGVGPKLSDRLNALGIYHYRQIAIWTKAQGRWVDEQLAFKGRVARENWVQQARTLMKSSAA